MIRHSLVFNKRIYLMADNFSDFGTRSNSKRPSTKKTINANIELRIFRNPSIKPNEKVPMAKPIFSAKSKKLK